MTGLPRAPMSNTLRLFSLFGIVVLNVQDIACSALHSVADPVRKTVLDAVTLPEAAPCWKQRASTTARIELCASAFGIVRTGL